MIETEEGILHSETDPEVAIIQGGHAKRYDYYRDRGNSTQQRLRHQSRSPTRRCRVAHQGLKAEIDRCFYCRQFGHFAKACPQKDTSLSKVQHGEERITKHYDAHTLKVTQKKMKKKRSWQQYATVVKLTMSSKQKER